MTVISITEALKGRNATPATASPATSTNALVRLDDAALARMTEIAQAPLPALPTIDRRQFDEMMRIFSTLPHQSKDAVSGPLIVEIYWSSLRNYPAPAMVELTQWIMENCRWFPALTDLRERLAKWQRNDDAVRDKALAQHAVQVEINARLDDAMDALRDRTATQAEVNAWPQRWRDIGMTHGYLDADGILRFPA